MDLPASMKLSIGYSRPHVHQKCTTHFKRNMLTYVKADHQEQLADELREIFMTGRQADSSKQAQTARNALSERLGSQYRHIRSLAERDDLHYYFTYLDCERRVQSMIPATNWVERFN